MEPFSEAISSLSKALQDFMAESVDPFNLQLYTDLCTDGVEHTKAKGIISFLPEMTEVAEMVAIIHRLYIIDRMVDEWLLAPSSPDSEDTVPQFAVAGVNLCTLIDKLVETSGDCVLQLKMAVICDILHGRDSQDAILEDDLLFSVPSDFDASWLDGETIDVSTQSSSALRSAKPVYFSAARSNMSTPTFTVPFPSQKSDAPTQFPPWSIMSKIAFDSPQAQTKLLQNMYHYVLNYSPNLAADFSASAFSPDISSTSVQVPSVVPQSSDDQEGQDQPPPPVVAFDFQDVFLPFNIGVPDPTPSTQSMPTSSSSPDSLFTPRCEDADAMQVDADESSADLPEPFISSVASGDAPQGLNIFLSGLKPYSSTPATPSSSRIASNLDGCVEVAQETPTKATQRAAYEDKMTPRKKALGDSLSQHSPRRTTSRDARARTKTDENTDPSVTNLE